MTAISRIRKPRKVTRRTLGCESWYYVDRKRVDVMFRIPGTGTYSASLTRRQLQQALALMQAVESETESHE